MKTALITGINGQDGSYLAEILLDKGYQVHGTKRRSSTVTTHRLEHLLNKDDGVDYEGSIHLHHADLTDASSLARIIDTVEPDEIYNLAAQSHVAVSFEEPEYTANSDALGVLRILEIIRRTSNEIKFYQASTSELFGGQSMEAYSEKSLIDPRSPYAAAKAYAYHLVKMYREAYGIFAVNGILFNHESPRRGENFVTRKITRGVAAIALGRQKRLRLGNLDASRDWGHARDYCKAMWLMLQQDLPEDFVIATGSTTSVREFVQSSFEALGIKIEFQGQKEKEHAICVDVSKSFFDVDPVLIGSVVMSVDPKFYRPLEVHHLLGDSAKARKILGWEPEATLDDLVSEMVREDYAMMSQELIKSFK